MPKILKSSQVVIDIQKKMHIDVPQQEFTVVEVEVEEPETDADSIIEKAKAQADEIISEASRIAEDTYAKLTETVEKAKNEGYEQGKASGYMDGYNEGMAQTEEQRQKAEQTYNSALAERIELLNSIEPELVGLMVNILDKLITDTIEINPQVILCLIRKGLADSNVTGVYKIYVSPDDYGAVSNELSQLSEYVDASSQLDLVRDYSMKKADCIIETPFGNIDCGLTQQYNSLKKNLLYILDNKQTG